jgi:hypothetical protein
VETRFTTHLRGYPTQKLEIHQATYPSISWQLPSTFANTCSNRASKLSRQPHERSVEGRVDIDKRSSEAVVKQIRGLAVSHSSIFQRCSKRRVYNLHLEIDDSAQYIDSGRHNITDFCLRVILNRFHHGHHKDSSRKLYG